MNGPYLRDVLESKYQEVHLLKCVFEASHCKWDRVTQMCAEEEESLSIESRYLPREPEVVSLTG